MKAIIKTIFIFLILSIFLLPSEPAQAMKTKLRVAFEKNLPPYQFVNDYGYSDGMHIELLNYIAKRNNFEIEYIPTSTRKEALDALNDGRVDIVLGEIIDKTSKYFLQSTNEISSSSLCLIAPDSIASYLSSDQNSIKYSIAYEYGTIAYSFISFLNASHYKAVSNQQEVFKTHINGDTDAMVGVKGSLLYQLKQAGLEKDYSIIYNYMSTIKYTMVVQKGDYELKRLLNNEINSLHASTKYQEIYNKWMVNETSSNVRGILRKVMYASAAIGAVALIYIIINHQIKTLLKRQVAEKTQKLNEINNELESRIRQIESESYLRNIIIESSHRAMLLLDKDNRITLANSSASILADVQAIPLGENILNIGLFKEILKHKVNHMFQKDYILMNELITLQKETGELKTYRLNINQTLEKGQVSGVLVTVEDVTQEEKKKNELFEKEKNKALNRIIAGIAHEIRNPLMSIRTFATLISTQGNDPEFQNSFSQFVPNEVDRINKLIDSLINYAKPVKREMTAVDINSVITDCLYLTAPVIKKGEIAIDLQVKEGLIIKANSSQIKQVLINIIMNGIESMEKKLKTIAQETNNKLYMTISIWAEEDYVFVSIRDDGLGMSAKELSRCTDPFFTTKAAGTGLGLALSKVFIEENNGELLIESAEMEYTNVLMKFRRYYIGEAQDINNR